ncbi:hypothetical protein KY334_02580, partial [Candidatus Woesearchaeota archaeon]|nr:hypothetical protein [Candidatus Woesearchaeota archaeon]
PRNIIDDVLGNDKKEREAIQIRVPFKTRIALDRVARNSGKNINEIMSFFTELSVKHYEYSILHNFANIQNKTHYYPLVLSKSLDKTKSGKKINEFETDNDKDKVFFYVSRKLKDEFKFAIAKKAKFIDRNTTQKNFLISWVELAIQTGELEYKGDVDAKVCINCKKTYFKNELYCDRCDKKGIIVDCKCLIFK